MVWFEDGGTDSNMQEEVKQKFGHWMQDTLVGFNWK